MWLPYSVPVVLDEENEEEEDEEYFETEFDLGMEYQGRIRKKVNRKIKQDRKTRSNIGNIVKSHMKTDEENETVREININDISKTYPIVKIHIGRRELKKLILKTERVLVNFNAQKNNVSKKLKQRNQIRKKEILDLQYRELTPEDYEILLTLDDKVKKKTTNKLFVENLCSHEFTLKEDILINDILSENKVHNELLYREITPEDYDILLTLDDSLESKLTDKSIVENLTQQQKGNNKVENCVICMTDIKHNDSIAVLPICGHRFHTQCISKWLLNCSQQCPIDMSYVQ